ncbi:ricin B-like lectin EULS3 [Medicago truncatula]|nr:ricin B-like lectin EULS3 [Medicago truncatula]
MEFPFNHNTSNVTHTHHHRRDDDNNEQHYPPPGHNNLSSFNQPPPPPHHQQPPFYPNPSYPPPPQQQPHQPETQVFHTGHVSRNDNFNNYPQQPQPHQETQVFHTGHVSHENFNSYPQPPPPQSHHQQPSYGAAYPPAPPSVPDHTSAPFPNATVHHVSHETHNPHFPSSNVHHVNHEPTAPPLSSNRSTFKIVTKASPNYSLTIRRGEVVLAPSDPSDQHQHWYKDVKWSTKVKDKDGYPSFALVNKVTGEAIKHSIGASHPVRLIRYNPDYLDQSVLWTESKDQGSGYRAVRMVNNIQLNMDAFHGDKNSGGVHDGTTVVLWDWNKGDNQQWKILPY